MYGCLNSLKGINSYELYYYIGGLLGIGTGGAGASSSISGSPVTYSAGNVGVGTNPSGPSGSPNTGDGGAARNGSGGSGIVIIRYKFQ